MDASSINCLRKGSKQFMPRSPCSDQDMQFDRKSAIRLSGQIA